MKAVIIGAGIIGLCSAYYLEADGWEVMIVDDSKPMENCSYGNAGMIVPSHFTPFASPGVIEQGLKWMLNSKSPFFVRPALNGALFKWAYHFVRNATEKHVTESALPLASFHLLSKHLYQELARAQAFNFSLREQGIIMYFKTEKAAEEEYRLAAQAAAFGLDVRVMSAADAREMESGTELDVLGGVLYNCDAHLNPEALMRDLSAHLKSKGVKICTGTSIKEMEVVSGSIKKVIVAGETFEADLFVLAAGSRLQRICRMAGISISIIAGKGYSYTQNFPLYKLKRPALLCEARVAVTPLNGTMRYAGTMELGKPHAAVNERRVRGILESVSAYFPGIQVQMPNTENIWFGFRPCSPDGLPYIGRSCKVKNAIVAGGHGMMGVSLGPATGKLIAQIAGCKSCSIDVSRYSPDRFHC